MCYCCVYSRAFSSPPRDDHQVADLDALKAEEASQKSKLEQKLNARRKKKTEELKQREEKELKNKQTRDAKTLEV